MRLTSFYIFIVSCIVCAISSTDVYRTTPIFGKCIDKELRVILKIITVTQNGNRPVDLIETNQEVENLMRMIKVYLAEEQISANSGRKSRKFFFWPFRPWSYRMPSSVEGGLIGSIYGGYGADGFSVGADLNGGLQGLWKKHYE